MSHPKCEYCQDDSGRCNDPVFDEADTYFFIKLRSWFQNVTVCNLHDMFLLWCMHDLSLCLNVSFFLSNATSASLALQDVTFVTRSMFKISMKLLEKKLILRRNISFLRLTSLMNQRPHSLAIQNGMQLCKTYAIYDNMKIAFDLGRRRRGSNVFRDDEISMELGDMISVQCSCEFVNQQFC